MDEIYRKTEMYKHLIENATEGILVSDEKGVIKIVNQSIVDLFGYTQEELLGEKIEILIPNELKKKHKSHVSGYVKKPEKKVMGSGRDLFGRKKDGTTIPVEISLNHTVLEGSFCVMALITDITERKKIEYKIQELNERLEQKVIERTKKLNESQVLHNLIALNFPNGSIGVLDKSLNYIFIEGKELSSLNLKSESLVGTNYLDCFSNENLSIIKSKLKAVFRGKSLNFDISKNKNIYNVDAAPLIFDENEISQILIVEHNITKTRKVEQKIKDSLAKEKELSELKSKFVSMASHEFRTPLSTILSSVSLIEKYDELGEKEKQKKHFSKVKKTIKNLTAILDDTLTISKIEENLTRVKLSKFNVKHLIEDVINESSGLKKSGQEIEFYPIGNENIVTDNKLFRVIISNLLSNALKYSNTNVKIFTEVTDSFILVKIEDKGIGIPEKEQQRLFERFFRANNVTNIQGTGLGLNIVKGYVTKLKGKIILESKVNEGTTVTFKLLL